MTEVFSNINLAWTPDAGFIIGDHLTPLSNPTWQTTQCEQRGEHAVGESHCAVDQPGVEVDVWIQFALDEVVIVECALFEAHGDFETLVVSTELVENLFCGGFYDARAWVVDLVDAVTKAHQPDTRFFVFDLVHEFLWAQTLIFDLVQHVQHGFVSATVQWAKQCVDPGGNGTENVGV